MGIQPTIFAKSNHNPLCFPVDQTPEKLIVSISGIDFGDLWNPGDPNPPNGNFYCTKTGTPGEWIGSNSKASNVVVSWTASSTILTVEVSAAYYAFEFSSTSECLRWMENDHDNSKSFAYWGGFASIMVPVEIVTAVETIVPVFIDHAFFEVFPGPAKIVDLRYANRVHRQNITVQYDTDQI